MAWIRQSDFCRKYNCSKITIADKRKKYAKELDGHVLTGKGIVQFDETAVELLKPHSVKLQEQRQEYFAMAQENAELKETVEQLKLQEQAAVTHCNDKIDELQSLNFSLQKSIDTLTASIENLNYFLSDEKRKNQNLCEELAEKNRIITDLQNQLTEQKSEFAKLSAERSKKKGLFGSG